MSTSIKGGGSPFIENFFEDDNLNATNLFNNMEPPLAEELLKKVIAAHPSSSKWGDALGNLYFLESQQTASRVPKALAEFETAQSLDKDEASQSFRLSNLTKSAYASGDMEKAAHYANALLESAQKNPHQWNYGDVIHQGEHDPGSHRLKKRRHRTSKILSDQSRQYASFPSTDSFGSNISLARDLIATRDKDTSLQYFALCRKFWKMGNTKLDAWEVAVKDGKTPDFGANLVY